MWGPGWEGVGWVVEAASGGRGVIYQACNMT